MSRLLKYQLINDLAVANSPSRKDGMSPEIEANRRKVAARHIYETGHAFSRSVGTPAIAVTFFLRYFTRKSMKRNDPFIIAAGCLFLAGKVNDEPMPAQNLVVEMFKRWYGRENPLMRHRLADTTFIQNLFSAVLEAERAILYTVGFDFNVDLPHPHIATLLRLPRFTYLQNNVYFHQLAVNFCNDIMRKDGTMVLQYSAREIAIAVYYYIFKAAKRENLVTIPQPEPEPDGTPWYINEGLDVQRCGEIVKRISSLYRDRGPGVAASSQPAASAATTMMPGASAGAASESAAGGAVAAVGQQQDTAAGGVDSTAKQRSPGRQQAEAGQKRGLGAAGEAPASKSARLAPTSAQAPPGPAGSAAPVEHVCAKAEQAAPAQPAASEPEEGELEEGELAD